MLRKITNGLFFCLTKRQLETVAGEEEEKTEVAFTCLALFSFTPLAWRDRGKWRLVSFARCHLIVSRLPLKVMHWWLFQRSFCIMHRCVLSLFMLGERVLTGLHKFKLPEWGKTSTFTVERSFVWLFLCTISPILKKTNMFTGFQSSF